MNQTLDELSGIKFMDVFHESPKLSTDLDVDMIFLGIFENYVTKNICFWQHKTVVE